MKLNKSLIATIGISFFSTIVLGNLNIQQVKADTSNPSITSTSNDNSSTNSFSTSDSTDSSNPNSSSNSKNISNSTDSSTPSTLTSSSNPTVNLNSVGSNSEDTSNTVDNVSSNNTSDSTSTNDNELQQSNITLTDSNGNKVINSKNQEFSLSDKYKVGTDITSLLPDDLKKAYKIDAGQNTTITAGTTDYNLKVTANKTNLIMKVYGKNSDGAGSGNTTYNVPYGTPVTLAYSNGLGSVDKYVFKGYAFTKLVDRNGNDLPTANGSTITFTYDMPAISDTDSSNVYIIYAIYDIPTNQSLNVNYLDDQGKQLFTDSPKKYNDGTDILTGDSISNVSNFLNIDNKKYTYWKMDPILPYTVTDDNSLTVYLLENDLNYTTVNYTDENGNTIYTDKLRGEVGQTVTPKDIATINPSYHMVDSIKDHTVTEKNTTLNLHVSDVLTLHLVQKVNGDIVFDSQTTNKAFTKILLKDNVKDIDSVSYGVDDTVQATFTSDQLTEFDTISTLLNMFPSAGLNYAVINYKTSDAPTVSYQDETGKEVSNFTLTTTSNAIQSIKDNVPPYYSLLDEDNPYTVNKDGKIISTIKNNSASSISGKNITLSNGQNWNPDDAISSVTLADGTNMTAEEIAAAIKNGSITTTITNSDGNTIDSLDTTKTGKYSVTYSYKDVTGKTVSSQPITLTIEAKDFSGIVAKDSTIKNGASWQPSDNISSVTKSDGSDMTDEEIAAAIENKNITTSIVDADGSTIDSLDTTKTGKYTVTYSYKDDTGHTVSSQPITLTINDKDKGAITTKDSTIENGASWQSSDNISTVTKSDGSDMTDNEITTAIKDGTITTTITDSSGNTVDSLDTTKAGTYKITYNYKDEDENIISTSSTLTINVKDQSSITAKDSIIENGASWQPSDNISSVTKSDGSAMTTNEIAIAIKDGTITTAITDSDGNTLNSPDTTKAGKYTITYTYTINGKIVSSQPVILTVNAKDQSSITAKDSTIKNGASWQPSDNISFVTKTDGSDMTTNEINDAINNGSIKVIITDPSGNIVTSIDTTNVGDYKVTYTYTDDKGNSTTINPPITVTVSNPVVNNSALSTKDSTLKAGNTWNPVDNVKTIVDSSGNSLTASQALTDKTLTYTIQDSTGSTVDSVDTTKVGSYKITYSYTDTTGKVLTSTAAITVTKDPADNNGSNSSGTGNSNNNSTDQPDSNNSDDTEIFNGTITISTIDAKIYDDKGNFTNWTLTLDSNWLTDRKMSLNGQTYYRVATNQWVKVSDTYVYYNNTGYIKTYSGNYPLVDSQGKIIANASLNANGNWRFDRYAYFNNQKYYRVATNKWINAENVFEYQPISKILNTKIHVKLFDSNGNVVRTISSLSLKTDQAATINGTKMYRVATNEWIKATDVKNLY